MKKEPNKNESLLDIQKRREIQNKVLKKIIDNINESDKKPKSNK